MDGFFSSLLSQLTQPGPRLIGKDYEKRVEDEKKILFEVVADVVEQNRREIVSRARRRIAKELGD